MNTNMQLDQNQMVNTKTRDKAYVDIMNTNSKTKHGNYIWKLRTTSEGRGGVMVSTSAR